MPDIDHVLGDAARSLRSDPDPAVIGRLASLLAPLYDEAARSGRVGEFRDACQSHPVAGLLLTDPYARRALDKPRGYAGDAVMLDYIYRPNPVALPGIGTIVHAATTSLPSAMSILWRRDYIARLIHGLMLERPVARVLSVASGHMRELDALQSLTSDRNVRFVAIDQDAESVFEALASYGQFDIDGRVDSFAGLIRGRLSGERFDLVYSAGLFDYLDDSAARTLIASMFAHLAPGGTVSVGNFTRTTHGRGFMAGFMDWELVYRDEDDLMALADDACPDVPKNAFRDATGNIAYVEIRAH